MPDEAERARNVVRFLYRHFVANPGELPPELIHLGHGVERAAVDYIAGMTDLYAIDMAARVLK
ncbi:MAG: deoxyguanosinetriphosphate triphosphohydrolase, partial [Dehalococcoidia bacterium]|nr:deoxyguanosinetriphosphate triphosphohydrolase [Dehalococcoidia bacterium]